MRDRMVKLFDVGKAPPLLFAIVLYLIGITVNSLSDAINNSTGLGSWQITGFGVVFLLIIFLLLDPITKYIDYLLARSARMTATIGEKPDQQKGLIVFSSPRGDPNKQAPAEAAIRYHLSTLQRCWIITGGKSSYTAAIELIKKLVNEGYNGNIFAIKQMQSADADNPMRVYEAIEEVYKERPEGLSEGDIIADYTGGTKSMTAGMVLACAPPLRKIQFLKPNEYDENGYILMDKGSNPKLVHISFDLKKIK